MARGYSKDQPQGFTNRIERVAIVGAGGHMGKHLTEHLLKTGKHIVTAITRPESTSKLPEGVHVARVDYTGGDDDTALIDTLRGHQALIITLSIAAPRSTTMSKLLRAAAAAGVSYVLPNWFGHDPANEALCDDSLLRPGRDELRAEVARLGDHAPRLIFLACGFWYEFSLAGGPDRFGFDFARRSLVMFGDGGDDVPIRVSTWPQCGRAVAALLSLPELPHDEGDDRSSAATLSRFCDDGSDNNNSTVPTAVYISSFRISQRDMFESVKRVTGTADADWTVTRGEPAEKRWRDGRAAIDGGDFSAFTKMLYSRMFVPGGDDSDYESGRVLHNDVLGLPVEDLDACTAVSVRMGEKGEVAHSH
ncbi:hypothetical protein SLS62_000993 [Diatrype stigma]|uniref:NAD(P)-binding domain-containing protein n=1 Tax=Diatrype stigma TaxID=117547 RepID=A0AAN9YWA4_9PEZI